MRMRRSSSGSFRPRISSRRWGNGSWSIWSETARVVLASTQPGPGPSFSLLLAVCVLTGIKHHQTQTLSMCLVCGFASGGLINVASHAQDVHVNVACARLTRAIPSCLPTRVVHRTWHRGVVGTDWTWLVLRRLIRRLIRQLIRQLTRHVRW